MRAALAVATVKKNSFHDGASSGSNIRAVYGSEVAWRAGPLAGRPVRDRISPDSSGRGLEVMAVQPVCDLLADDHAGYVGRAEVDSEPDACVDRVLPDVGEPRVRARERCPRATPGEAEFHLVG